MHFSKLEALLYSRFTCICVLFQNSVFKFRKLPDDAVNTKLCNGRMKSNCLGWFFRKQTVTTAWCSFLDRWSSWYWDRWKWIFSKNPIEMFWKKNLKSRSDFLKKFIFIDPNIKMTPHIDVGILKCLNFFYFTRKIEKKYAVYAFAWPKIQKAEKCVFFRSRVKKHDRAEK